MLKKSLPIFFLLCILVSFTTPLFKNNFKNFKIPLFENERILYSYFYLLFFPYNNSIHYLFSLKSHNSFLMRAPTSFWQVQLYSFGWFGYYSFLSNDAIIIIIILIVFFFYIGPTLGVKENYKHINNILFTFEVENQYLSHKHYHHYPFLILHFEFVVFGYKEKL